MKRIMHFSYDCKWNPWIGGGGAVRLHEIYKRLAHDYDITVVCARHPGSHNRTVDGVKYRFVGWSPNYAASRVVYSLVSLLYSLTGFWWQRRYDVVVIDFDPFSFYIPIFNRCKTVGSVFHLYGQEPIRKYGLLGYPVTWFERIIPHWYRHRVFISESVCMRLPPNGGTTKVIYTGIDDSLFNLPTEENDYVLSLGRIDLFNKGHDILIPAFKRLRSQAPHLRLVVAGDGKDMAQLLRLIKEHGVADCVETPGRISSEQKEELLRKSLFVVMPSRYEGWGIVAIEAAACGKATVGTDIDGLRDSIVNNQTGLLCQKENVEDLFDKMRILAFDPDRRRLLGDQGRKRARLFSWDAIASEQSNYFESVVLH